MAVLDLAGALGYMVDRHLLLDLVVAGSAGSTRLTVCSVGVADLAVDPLNPVCILRGQGDAVLACLSSQVLGNAVTTQAVLAIADLEACCSRGDTDEVSRVEFSERKDDLMWRLLRMVRDYRPKVLAVLIRCENVWSLDGLSSPTMIAETLDDPKGADYCSSGSDSVFVTDRTRTLRE